MQPGANHHAGYGCKPANSAIRASTSNGFDPKLFAKNSSSTGYPILSGCMYPVAK